MSFRDCILRYLDSQGLEKVEGAITYSLFVRYVEGSSGNEPSDLL